MPTIAEILAAKKAKAAGTSNVERPTPNVEPKRKETLAERLEMDAVLDRIDPPGKQAAAATARKMVGLVLSKDMPLPPGENRGQATPIKGPEDLRSLGQPMGEAIDLTPLEADDCIRNWHKAVAAFDTDLVLMRDPMDPQRAWLAVRLEEAPMDPILIKSLPLFEHPRAHRQPAEPF